MRRRRPSRATPLGSDYKPAASDNEEVFADLPRIHHGLRLLTVPCSQHDAYETDDVIAALAASRDADRRRLS